MVKRLARRRRAEANGAQASQPSNSCQHLDAAAGTDDPEPGTPGRCQECAQLGESSWAHLRICLTCGHIGCCDSSAHQHAFAHFHQTGHPVMRSHEPGEDWRWCYVDVRLG